jgi:hypothetical protein
MSKRLPRPPRPRRVGDLPRVHSQISVVKVTARSRGLLTLACNCDSLTCSREDSAITVGSHFGSRRTALQRDRLPSGIGLTASSARMKGPTPGDPHHHRRLGAFVAEPCTGNTVLSGGIENRLGEAEPDVPVVGIGRAPAHLTRLFIHIPPLAHRPGWAGLFCRGARQEAMFLRR